MIYEYKTLFELDPQNDINRLAKVGWEVLHSAPMPLQQDACYIYVLMRRQVAR